MKTNTHRTKVFCRRVAAAFALMGACGAFAEENCGAWHTADADPTSGQFIIELRTCDLTYGLSAYVQIRNSSDKRLALSYRIITKDDKSRDSDIVLEPGSITRAGNCQACAKRHAGFKSWELLSAKATKDQPEIKAEAPAATVSASPVVPAAVPAAPATASAQTVVKEVPPTPVPAKVADQPRPVEAAPADDSAKNTEKQVEGFKAEDGTIIPWDQLPPEFRPRK